MTPMQRKMSAYSNWIRLFIEGILYEGTVDQAILTEIGEEVCQARGDLFLYASDTVLVKLLTYVDVCNNPDSSEDDAIMAFADMALEMRKENIDTVLGQEDFIKIIEGGD